MGAEGAGGSTQVVVGLGSRRPPTVTLWRSDRAGSDHLGERWAWPCRRSRILNTLNEIWVFDLSLATGLYALTNYAGKIWALDVVVSAEAFVTSATEWRAPHWIVSSLLY